MAAQFVDAFAQSAFQTRQTMSSPTLAMNLPSGEATTLRIHLAWASNVRTTSPDSPSPDQLAVVCTNVSLIARQRYAGNEAGMVAR